MSWEEQAALGAAGIKARLEERRQRDAQAIKAWRREPEASTGSRASAILAGLKTPPRPLVPKSGAADEFERLEREVQRGRPISGIARHAFEKEKARRKAESDGS
jgi:hypothetical protein